MEWFSLGFAMTAIILNNLRISHDLQIKLSIKRTVKLPPNKCFDLHQKIHENY